MIINAEVVVQQSADGLICIQLDKNDWTVEDKHLGGETDATSALITVSQIAPLRKHMEPLQMDSLVLTESKTDATSALIT